MYDSKIEQLQFFSKTSKEGLLSNKGERDEIYIDK